MLKKITEWVGRHLRSRYVRALEEDVERLRGDLERMRGENRGLVNSLLGTAGFPPIALDDELRHGGPAMTAVRRRTWTQIAREREMAAGKSGSAVGAGKSASGIDAGAK